MLGPVDSSVTDGSVQQLRGIVPIGIGDPQIKLMHDVMVWRQNGVTQDVISW
jgi:hypothetical protein